MHTLEARFSASSICCVDTNIALSPLAYIFLISAHILSRDLRSKFEVGSSRMINFASPMRDIAIESLRLEPGDI